MKTVFALLLALPLASQAATTIRCKGTYEDPGLSCCGRTIELTFEPRVGGSIVYQNWSQPDLSGEYDRLTTLRVESLKSVSRPVNGTLFSSTLRGSADGADYAVAWSFTLSADGNVAVLYPNGVRAELSCKAE